MKKTRLGNSSLEVSQLCFGTMYFGSKIDYTASATLLDHFAESSGNFIDTANNYAFWEEGCVGDESENVIGKWISERRNRDKIVLATKTGARPRSRDSGIDDLEGLSHETIIDAVEQSLKRLQTDYIDLYYAHVDWYEFPLEERLKAFDLLIQQGKVREIGISNTYTWRVERSRQIAQENKWKNYCCVQQKYSYLRPKHNADFWVQKLIDEEWLNYGLHNPDISLIGYSPLLQGAYTKNNAPLVPEYETPDNHVRLNALSEVASESGATKNQIVLAWMIQHSPSVIPVIAASKMIQLDENLGALNIDLTKHAITKLNEAGD